jgi:hypothetical protein
MISVYRFTASSNEWGSQKGQPVKPPAPAVGIRIGRRVALLRCLVLQPERQSSLTTRPKTNSWLLEALKR